MSSGRKDRGGIGMLKRIGPEFHCLKGYGLNSNVKKDRAGIPLFERIGLEFQC